MDRKCTVWNFGKFKCWYRYKGLSQTTTYAMTEMYKMHVQHLNELYSLLFPIIPPTIIIIIIIRDTYYKIKI